jgi:hypothetical protein
MMQTLCILDTLLECPWYQNTKKIEEEEMHLATQISAPTSQEQRDQEAKLGLTMYAGIFVIHQDSEKATDSLVNPQNGNGNSCQLYPHWR